MGIVVPVAGEAIVFSGRAPARNRQDARSMPGSGEVVHGGPWSTGSRLRMQETKEGRRPITRARVGRVSMRNNLRAGSAESLVRTPHDHPLLDRFKVYKRESTCPTDGNCGLPTQRPEANRVDADFVVAAGHRDADRLLVPGL